MTAPNPYLAAEKAGIVVLLDYAAAANDKDRVQLLIDLIAPDSTATFRGLLGNMTVSAQRQLLVELDALKVAVT